MTWGKNLNDISNYLNAFVNKRTWESINEINNIPESERVQLSCYDVHSFILKQYNKNKGFDFISEVESLAYNDLTLSRFPKQNTGRIATINQSIYKKSKLFKLKIFGININVNNVYFGIDKLDHIFRTGFSYYKTYQKYLAKTGDEQAAQIKAIEKGIRQEKTYYGYWVSGVFSFADLEANYQGLRFHKSFCSGKNPYIFKYKNGRWGLNRQIDLKDYINPWFDESYYPNAYTKKRFRSISEPLMKYCKEPFADYGKQRFSRYQNTGKKSFSVTYLEQKIKLGLLPDNQRFGIKNICNYYQNQKITSHSVKNRLKYDQKKYID